MEIVTVLTYKNNYICIMILNNDYARGKKMHICKWYLMAANVVTTRLINISVMVGQICILNNIK